MIRRLVVVKSNQAADLLCRVMKGGFRVFRLHQDLLEDFCLQKHFIHISRVLEGQLHRHDVSAFVATYPDNAIRLIIPVHTLIDWQPVWSPTAPFSTARITSKLRQTRQRRIRSMAKDEAFPNGFVDLRRPGMLWHHRPSLMAAYDLANPVPSRRVFFA